MVNCSVRKSQENSYNLSDLKQWEYDTVKIYLHDLTKWFEDDTKDICFADLKISSNKSNNFKRLESEVIMENTENKNAFEDFVKIHLNNLQYKNKFVAFVNGEFQDISDKRNALIEKMYDKFGNVDMYVDKITDQRKIILIDTPEFN